MRCVIYTRVSRADQTCDNQLRDLREYCRARGWADVREYVDHGVSGTKDRRPALDQMMAAVRGRKVDIVVVAAFDRFGRSVRHLVESLETFRHLGVEFISLREQIDTGSPLGQAVFTIIAAIAQLERSLIGLADEGRSYEGGRVATVARRTVPTPAGRNERVRACRSRSVESL